MGERKQQKEQNNTGMTIAAIIAILLIIGLIAYFVMGNNDVEDAIDDSKEKVENIIDNDNETKTVSDVAGSYQGKIGADGGTDEDTPVNEDDYIELVLKEDSTAKLVITTSSKNIIEGSYTISDNIITISSSENTNVEMTDDNETTDTNTAPETYQFTINDDNTLSYMPDNNVTLSKVENNILKYIK